MSVCSDQEVVCGDASCQEKERSLTALCTSSVKGSNCVIEAESRVTSSLIMNHVRIESKSVVVLIIKWRHQLGCTAARSALRCRVSTSISRFKCFCLSYNFSSLLSI